MLPFSRTVPLTVNSSGYPAGRGRFASDGRRKSFLELWRTRARLKSTAFSPALLATINARGAEGLIPRYRESPPDAMCLRSIQSHPHKHRACRCAASCRAAFRTIHEPAAREFLRPCVARSTARAYHRPMEPRLHFLRESGSRSRCRIASLSFPLLPAACTTQLKGRW